MACGVLGARDYFYDQRAQVHCGIPPSLLLPITTLMVESMDLQKSACPLQIRLQVSLSQALDGFARPLRPC